jgi:salicylate synthetase
LFGNPYQGDVVDQHSWTGNPGAVIGEAVDRLLLATDRLYGWVAFRVRRLSLRIAAPVAARHAAGAHLPAHTQLVITETEVRFGNADTRYTRVLQRLLADGVPAAPPAAPIDVSGDGADYCGRVATAIGEIEERRYQKVILSRRFDVPFALDFPATYRVGRRHNTPARSFLLRAGGIRALGFSPDLVAAVHGDGMVVTEPLAGTGRLAAAETTIAPRATNSSPIRRRSSSTRSYGWASAHEGCTPVRW